MANGDIPPQVTVLITSHQGATEIVIPCKSTEQSDFIGNLVAGLVNAVKTAYQSGT